eukprot:s5390_g4.t2
MLTASQRSLPVLVAFAAAVFSTAAKAAAPRRQTAGTSAFLGQDKSRADRIEAVPPSLSPVGDLGDDVGAPSAFWPVVPLHTGLKAVEPSKHSPLWKVVGRSRKPVAKHSHPHMDIEAFFSSTVAGQWVAFGMVWLLLLRLSLFIHQLALESCLSHVIALGVWVLAAMGFLAWTFASAGSSAGEKWLDGYVMELVLSMENIFLYHMILVSFKVPAKMARYALFLVSIFQMLFQMFMFMGIAAWIRDLKVLPYLLGAWLVLVTMMGPVTCCLLLVMFAMEVDVTLTKIEEIDSHFIAWSSSVLAAFALPELFVVVRVLLRSFYLLKIGISLLVIFFGILLLFRDDVQLSDATELAVMVSIVVGSIIMSPMLGYKHRDATMYCEERSMPLLDCLHAAYWWTCNVAPVQSGRIAVHHMA